MPNFSLTSRNQLRTLDGRLQRLLYEAIRIVDFSITEGHRTNEKQLEYYNTGRSKVKHSKHNSYPSLAVDIAPSPYPNPKDEKELRQLYYLMGIIQGLSHIMNIPIRFGGDWNMNNDIRDDAWQDAWHIEIV